MRDVLLPGVLGRCFMLVWSFKHKVCSLSKHLFHLSTQSVSCMEAQGEVILQAVGPHSLCLAASEVGRKAGNEVWANGPQRSSRTHMPAYN